MECHHGVVDLVTDPLVRLPVDAPLEAQTDSDKMWFRYEGDRAAVFPGTVLGALLIQSVENGLVILNADPLQIQSARRPLLSAPCFSPWK